MGKTSRRQHHWVPIKRSRRVWCERCEKTATAMGAHEINMRIRDGRIFHHWRCEKSA